MDDLGKKETYIYQNEFEINEVLKTLSGRRIVFGHQSVGNNIVDGLISLTKEYNVPLNVIKTRDFPDTSNGYFAHTLVGANKDPLSKILDFNELIKASDKDSIEVAFFKFCYIDIRSSDNIQEIFSAYRQTMMDLRSNYPNIKFILVTTPLRALQKGLKAMVKKIMGRHVGELNNNIKRNEFNEMIRNEMSVDFPVFDLELVEATLPDGHLSTFTHDGKVYRTLPWIYTADGGHLNDYGKKLTGGNLAYFLSGL